MLRRCYRGFFCARRFNKTTLYDSTKSGVFPQTIYNRPTLILQFVSLGTLKGCPSKIRTPKIYERHLRTMKLDTPEFHALFNDELVTLINLFKKYGYEIRIAGGPVRDLLLGKLPHDIDLATTATPEQMKEMFELEKVRMINNKGESHGTITARINDKENYEVTTLRIDIRTDGRHAEVEFTKDWSLDANRRDLTINSMFLDFDGNVYDFFNGHEDLKERKVRFVGNPEDRIQEDYLRILRYFRFYGRIAQGPDCHEEATIRAIKENGAGLAGIAGERLWVEMKKILEGNYASSLLVLMIKQDLGQYLGLPISISSEALEEFQLVCSRCEGLSATPMTKLSALLANPEELAQLHSRLKLSTEEYRTAAFIINHRGIEAEVDDSDRFKQYKCLLCSCVIQDHKAKERVLELLKYKGDDHVRKMFEAWDVPKFPVTGRHLMDKDIPKGPTYKKVLTDLREAWALSDFTLSAEDLLKNIDDLVEKHKPKKKSKSKT